MTAADPPVILIIEDEAMVLIDLAEMFREAGYRAVMAGNLAAGRQLARRYRDSLAGVCIDITLPDGRADALVDEIAAQSPQARILICSARPGEEIECRALGEGRARLLSKPFRSEDALRFMAGP